MREQGRGGDGERRGWREEGRGGREERKGGEGERRGRAGMEKEGDQVCMEDGGEEEEEVLKMCREGKECDMP